MLNCSLEQQLSLLRLVLHTQLTLLNFYFYTGASAPFFLMATTTIDTDTELSAVNSILGAIGQSPQTTLNFDNPEVSVIFNLLRDSNVDTQAEAGILTQNIM